jgi:hypothetical protein
VRRKRLRVPRTRRIGPLGPLRARQTTYQTTSKATAPVSAISVRFPTLLLIESMAESALHKKQTRIREECEHRDDNNSRHNFADGRSRLPS